MPRLRSLVRHLQAAKHDLACAPRGLARSPGLTLTIIVSLSLGVGANVAVFTAIDRVFLQAPPGVAKPDQMRRLNARIFSRERTDGPTGRVVQNLSTRDLEVLGVTVLVLVAAAALASLVPVWRALRVSPAVALRAE